MRRIFWVRDPQNNLLCTSLLGAIWHGKQLPRNSSSASQKAKKGDSHWFSYKEANYMISSILKFWTLCLFSGSLVSVILKNCKRVSHIPRGPCSLKYLNFYSLFMLKKEKRLFKLGSSSFPVIPVITFDWIYVWSFFTSKEAPWRQCVGLSLYPHHLALTDTQILHKWTDHLNEWTEGRGLT